jgi:hypothetical protein
MNFHILEKCLLKKKKKMKILLLLLSLIVILLVVVTTARADVVLNVEDDDLLEKDSNEAFDFSKTPTILIKIFPHAHSCAGGFQELKEESGYCVPRAADDNRAERDGSAQYTCNRTHATVRFFASSPSCYYEPSAAEENFQTTVYELKTCQKFGRDSSWKFDCVY